MFSMRRVIGAINGATLLLVAYIGMMLVPLNWFWFAPGTFIIAPTTEGQPAIIVYERQIKRRTLIDWSVIVRSVGGLTAACDARGGPYQYLPESVLPQGADLNLDWWTAGDPDCLTLPPGEYTIETCWTAHDLLWGALPEKTVCTGVHAFSVAPRKG